MSSGKPSYELLHQGSVLSEHLHGAVLDACIDHHPEYKAGYRMVVVSQDCDIVAKLKSEPYVELIIAKVFRKPNSSIMHGKSSRLLVVPAGEIFLEMSVHDRFRVKKDVVEWTLDDDCILSEDAVNEFKGWLARRYQRGAFPSEFESRVRQKPAELSALMSRDDAKAISGIYLCTSWDELPAEQTYELKVLLSKEVGSGLSESFEQDFEDILNSCDGIIVEDLDCKLEKDITLGLLREYRRWNQDQYSSETLGDCSKPVVD